MSDRRDGVAPFAAGYVPARANLVRDVVAAALLAVAAFLPWSIYFGFGIPGTGALFYTALTVLTVVAIAAALATHVGPLKLSAQSDARRTGRIRFWMILPYLVGVVAVVVFHIDQIVRYSGTGAVPPGVGPGAWLGVAGALLAAQPVLTATTIEDNSFHRWYAAARMVGMASIALAVVSVAYNFFLRLRYLFVTDSGFGGHDAAVVTTTVLYGLVALIAVVIGSIWLTQKTAAARLATIALGASAVLAGLLVWVLGAGRDVDAFHGIAQNTSTAAVGFEGFLLWPAAAAIVAPTTLYAVFAIRPPHLGVYRGAALKLLMLIAFWSFATAGLRLVDYVVMLSLDLPRSFYDTVALAAFNAATGAVAVWLRRNLAKGGLSSAVIAAFSGVIAVFAMSQLVVGVALAPRYDEPAPTAVYGNNLAQQITSTFDVAICGLSLAILAAVLLTGPLAGWVMRRRVRVDRTGDAATDDVTKRVPVGAGVAATSALATPTFGTNPTSAIYQRPAGIPKIVRVNETRTALIDSGPSAGTTSMPAATSTLRIQRRSSAAVGSVADATENIAAADTAVTEGLSAKARAELLLEESTRRFAAGTTYGGSASDDADKKRR